MIKFFFLLKKEMKKLFNFMSFNNFFFIILKKIKKPFIFSIRIFYKIYIIYRFIFFLFSNTICKGDTNKEHFNKLIEEVILKFKKIKVNTSEYLSNTNTDTDTFSINLEYILYGILFLTAIGAFFYLSRGNSGEGSSFGFSDDKGPRPGFERVPRGTPWASNESRYENGVDLTNVVISTEDAKTYTGPMTNVSEYLHNFVMGTVAYTFNDYSKTPEIPVNFSNAVKSPVDFYHYILYYFQNVLDPRKIGALNYLQKNEDFLNNNPEQIMSILYRVLFYERWEDEFNHQFLNWIKVLEHYNKYQESWQELEPRTFAKGHIFMYNIDIDEYMTDL